MSVAARIITVAQQKGGAGKTTLAVHLTVAWALQGQKVAAIDVDPQASFTHWAALRRKIYGDDLGFSFAQSTGWRLPGEVERMRAGHDIIVIDTPPHAETDARIAVRMASLVLVPLQPSPMDVWATRPTLELARSERRAVLLVINRLPPRSRLAAEMVGEAVAYDIGVATVALGNRVAFAQSLAIGRAVSETDRGEMAGEEIERLAKEILERAPVA
jgi:chromosome partitioning protein